MNVFPIKSCHALQVEEIQLDSRGVVDDRRFMLVDGNGRFVSQRKFPKLATVRAKFITATDPQGPPGAGGGQRVLHVSAPGMEGELKFAPRVPGGGTSTMEAGIWEDRVKLVDQGERPAEWFGRFIGHGGTFVRVMGISEPPSSPLSTPSGGDEPNHFHRLVSNLPASLRGRLPPMQLALADAGPVSLVSTESLEDVNRRLRERQCRDVPLSRFRMNIEVSGCAEAYEEDSWLLVRIGSVPFLAYTPAEVSGVGMWICY